MGVVLNGAVWVETRREMRIREEGGCGCVWTCAWAHECTGSVRLVSLMDIHIMDISGRKYTVLFHVIADESPGI